MSAAGHVAVGKIVKPHGVRGEVAVFALTENVERFAAGSTLGLSRSPDGATGIVPVRVESAREAEVLVFDLP